LRAESHSGVRVKYLPPYSPDFQPIEEAFSKIKAFLCQNCTYYSQTIGDGILFDMYKITEIITPEDAAGYFMHVGYFSVCMYIFELRATRYERCPSVKLEVVAKMGSSWSPGSGSESGWVIRCAQV
jgi:hypothetical protein